MQYDYIVVGAGAAGCVVASRLSENSKINVLLVEAGGSDRTPIIAMPAALPFAYQSKKLGWGYEAGPEPHLQGRSIDEKRGKVLGGSTSINAMIYNRGNPRDFDAWAKLGLKEWDYAHCLPYFKKMESFSGGGDDWRGDTGPMKITRCKAEHKLYDAFLRGGEQAGFQITPDHNGAQQEGLHVAQSYIHKGIRWSAPRGYLDPAQTRENLHILKHATVNQILIQHGQAYGIEVNLLGQTKRIECKKEVILSAGAFNTPKLLMLSGIGDGNELKPLGIEVKADVKAIGKNLENHPGVNLQYATDYQHSLVSELNFIGRAKLGLDWIIRKKGLGTTNFFETGAFLRTRPDVDYPNMQYEFLPLTRYVKNGKLEAIPGFQFWMDLSRPKSRGFVKLQSKNPEQAPEIVFNHLQDHQDLQDMIDGIRVARNMIQQPAWDKFRGKELNPGLDSKSDKELAQFVRHNLGTSYHPSGTCRMGEDPEDVVNAQGQMNAIKNLRIIDASIMPTTVTANLSAAIIMMAEKISDSILERKLQPSYLQYH